MSCRRLLFALGLWTLLCGCAAAEPLRALIVDGQNNRPWRETTPILRQLLEETELVTVDVATAPGPYVYWQDGRFVRDDFPGADAPTVREP